MLVIPLKTNGMPSTTHISRISLKKSSSIRICILKDSKLDVAQVSLKYSIYMEYRRLNVIDDEVILSLLDFTFLYI